MNLSFRFILFLICAFFTLQSLFAQEELYPRKNKNNKYGYVDRSKSYLIAPKFDKAFAFENGRAKIIQQGNWGLIDKSGNFLLKPKYEYIGWSNDGYFKWNSKNLSLTNTLVPAKNTFFHSEKGYYAYLENNKWGLIKPNGKKLKNEWDSLNYGEGGHFAAFLNEKGWTWIDENNKAPDEAFFHSVKPLSNGLLAVQKKENGKFSIYSEEGILKSDSQYILLESLNEDYIKARKHGLWIQLDKNAKPVNNKKYEDIRYIHWNNTLQYLAHRPWKFANKELKDVRSLDYSIRYKVGERLYAISNDDQMKLLLIGPDIHSNLESSDTVFIRDSLIVVQNKKTKIFTLLNRELQKLIEDITVFRRSENQEMLLFKREADANWSVFDLNNNKNLIQNIDLPLRFLDDDLLHISRNSKVGIFDTENKKWLIDTIYNKVEIVNDSLIIAKKADTCFLLNEEGIINDTLEYADFKVIKDSIIAFRNKNEKWQIKSIADTKRLLSGFRRIEILSSNCIALKKEKYWNLYDLKLQKYLLKTSFDTIFPAHSDYFLARKDYDWTILDEKGNKTFGPSDYYESIKPLYPGRWQVYRNGLAGLIDEYGILKISSQYEDFKKPEFGYIPFRFRSKWGLLDIKERFIIQPLNDKIEVLSDQYVKVWRDGSVGLKDMNDKTLISIDKDDIQENEFGAFIVRQENKYGYFNKNAQQIRPISYDEIRQLSEDFIAIKKNDYWRLIDTNGNYLSDMKFSKIYFDQRTSGFFFKEHGQWKITSLD